MMKNFEQNVLSNIDMIAAVNKVRFNELFEQIRQQAIENDGEYKVE